MVNAFSFLLENTLEETRKLNIYLITNEKSYERYSKYASSNAVCVLSNPRALHSTNPLDVLHSPFNAILNPINGVRNLLSRYDLIPCHFPEFFSSQASNQALESCKAADHILVPSEYVKSDIIERTNVSAQSITVIYPPLDNRFTARKSVEFRKSRPYILYPAAGRPHKNHRNLFSAMTQVDCELVLTTGEKHDAERFKELQRLADELNVSDKTKILGYLSKEELVSLYFGADALVFPSLGEGFGYPLVEAMSVGLPIACSNASCIPEIARGGAIYFNPKDPNDIASKINTILSNRDIRDRVTQEQRQIIKRYSADNAATKLVSLYISLAHNNQIDKIKSRRDGATKMRLANRHILEENGAVSAVAPSYGVLLDCSRLFDGSIHTGISRHIRTLAKGLLSSKEVALIPFYDPGARRYGSKIKDSVQTISVYGHDIGVYPKEQAEFLARTVSGSVVFHSPFHPLPAERHADFAYCLTIHDIIHLRRPDIYPEGQEGITSDIVNSIRENDEIICDSRFTADELRQYLGARAKLSITVAYLAGYGANISKIENSRFFRNKTIVVLHQRDPRKRFEHMLDVAGHYCESIDPQARVCVIGAKTTAADRDRIFQRPELEDKVTFVGTPSDEEMGEVFKRALCMLYLSEEEGFGLPPLEAMSWGCPPIIAKNSSMAEIYRGWPFLVPNHATSVAVAQRISELSTASPGWFIRAAETILSRYTVENMVADHRAAYQEAIRRHRRSTARR
ncbi:glycosyltransferase [Bauldia litoralis]|nr:glycosyltransferase [Bauldia litoralis]